MSMSGCTPSNRPPFCLWRKGDSHKVSGPAHSYQACTSSGLMPLPSPSSLAMQILKSPQHKSSTVNSQGATQSKFKWENRMLEPLAKQWGGKLMTKFILNLDTATYVIPLHGIFMSRSFQKLMPEASALLWGRTWNVAKLHIFYLD